MRSVPLRSFDRGLQTMSDPTVLIPTIAGPDSDVSGPVGSAATNLRCIEGQMFPRAPPWIATDRTHPRRRRKHRASFPGRAWEFTRVGDP